MRWAAFHLRALRHGCGLQLTLPEIDAMEWPEIQEWSEMLTDFLGKALPEPPKKTEPTL